MSDNICGQCGRTFKYKRIVVTHEKSLTGTLPFTCCGKGFPSRIRIQRHRCACHGDDKTYVCPTCGASFATKCDLELHMKQKKQAKIEACDDCGHKTVTKSEMKEHIKTHMEERSYICTICMKAYKHKASLSRHKATKHTQ